MKKSLMKYIWWAQLTNSHRATICGGQKWPPGSHADAITLYPQETQLGHAVLGEPEPLRVPTMAVHPRLGSRRP